MTATRCGRFEEAARYAQAAHELSPNFRPPLRYLAALRYHLRDEQGAAEALQELKLLEPDFTLELMASESYPVASLRGPPCSTWCAASWPDPVVTARNELQPTRICLSCGQKRRDGRVMTRSRSISSRLDDAARAGWLYYIAGKTQDEIAAAHGHLAAGGAAAGVARGLRAAGPGLDRPSDRPLPGPRGRG